MPNNWIRTLFVQSFEKNNPTFEDVISKFSWKQIIICAILVASYLSVSCQDEEYYEENYLRFENHVYNENIQTVQLNIDGNVMSAPIINLFANQKLRLSFDDLGEDHISYYYTLIHCSANWEDSELFSTEYIQGVPEDVIYENSYSRSIGQRTYTIG